MTEAIKKAMALLPAFKHELITAKNSGRIWVEVPIESSEILIAALEAMRGGADGTHVVVPVEPTPEQHEAGHAALVWYEKMTATKQVQRKSLWDTIYRAMINKAQEK
jgi:hypothetical protein